MKTIFTVTAGRTGTAWLADLLSQNLQTEAVHEFLGINDFGERMPDIRTMRNFNNFGNNEFVKAFWRRKFGSLGGDLYVETNHTLAKCGLVENLARGNLANGATLVCLRRDIVRQCLSYLERQDFRHITIAWQWYLHPSYALKIINPEPFAKLGGWGTALWYCYEMMARQEYYRQRYSGVIKVLDAKLEEIISLEGATGFLSEFGPRTQVKLPPPRNQNRGTAPAEIGERVSRAVSSISFDVRAAVRNAISRGFTFEAR